jgi:hypothetical protein
MSAGATERLHLRARITEMSAAEAGQRLGAARYEALSREDPHPMFVELVAGHEGVSTGKLSAGSGGRPAPKRWSRERISELTRKLAAGAPVYLGHHGPRREPVGEVVAAVERWVKGVLSAAGVAYIRDPQVRDRIQSGELDACSLEAEIECHRERSAETWIVDAVRKVTGIALGDSRREQPGFPGARVLAAVTEFGDEPAAATPPDPDERIHQLESRLADHESKITELTAQLEKYRAAVPARPLLPSVAAPPERARAPENPLIPRPRGW